MTTSSIVDQILQRKIRGAKIVANSAANVSQIAHHAYIVLGSDSNQYFVTFTDTKRCECVDFQRNGATLAMCKHTAAVEVFEAAWALIEREGEQLATLRAIVEAATGSELHRKRWEAVLSLLRHKAARLSAAVVLSAPAPTPPAPMPPIVDLRDYYAVKAVA